VNDPEGCQIARIVRKDGPHEGQRFRGAPKVAHEQCGLAEIDGDPRVRIAALGQRLQRQKCLLGVAARSS
jgi:hypothetical protein